MSQRLWVASGSWKGQGNEISPRVSENTVSMTHFRFLISRRGMCYFKPIVVIYYSSNKKQIHGILKYYFLCEIIGSYFS